MLCSLSKGPTWRHIAFPSPIQTCTEALLSRLVVMQFTRIMPQDGMRTFSASMLHLHTTSQCDEI